MIKDSTALTILLARIYNISHQEQNKYLRIPGRRFMRKFYNMVG
jgi:hypothetical protein